MAESGAGTGYGITPDSTTANEGDTVTFDITAPDGTYAWQIAGDIDAADVAGGELSGTVEVVGGEGIIAITLLEDGTLEGDETFAVELRLDAEDEVPVATSDIITVADTSTERIYTVSVSTQVTHEGQQVTWDFVTEGVVDGVGLWWKRATVPGGVTVVETHSPEVLLDSGTATAATDTTLTDTSKAWALDAHVGETVRLGEQTRVITSNTADQLLVAVPFDPVPVVDDAYEIITPADETVYTTEQPVDSYDIVESEPSFLADPPIIITGGVGSLTLTFVEDFSSEGPEYLVLEFYDEPGAPFGEGEVIATADPVIVVDTSNSVGVDFTVVPSATTLGEGASITVTVTSSVRPPYPHLLYATLDGTVNAADFAGHGLTHSVFIGEDLQGSFGITTAADALTEGEESFVINLRTGHGGGPIVETSALITLTDTSTSPPTYALSGPTTVAEGDLATLTATFTDVPDGAVFGWTISGDADAADFADGLMSGTVVASGGSAIISRPMAADSLTEGEGFEDGAVASATTDTLTDTGASWSIDEHVGRILKLTGGLGEDQFRLVISNTADTLTFSQPWDVVPDETTTYRLYTEAFRVHLHLGSPAGAIVAEHGPVRILDTSVNPPEYAIGGGGSQPEGGGFSFPVTTAYVLDALLYWTVAGTASGADFAEGGSGSISGGGGTINLTPIRDYLVEGNETFVVQLRTGSIAGPIVATSPLATIIDSVYSIAALVDLIREGDTAQFRVATEHDDPGATYYWTAAGSLVAGDFVDGQMSGSVTLSGGEGLITRATVDSGPGQGWRYFYLELRRDSVSGPVIAISTAVVVRERAVDVAAWADSLDAARILLIEMDHSEGTVRFGNYPYCSLPSDTVPHLPFDDILLDSTNIQSRIDGYFAAGQIRVANDLGELDDWIGYRWRGFEIRQYRGEPGWSFDDFPLTARLTNGGLESVEPGRLTWSILDGKAVFAEPLQTALMPDGNPVPLALGAPFNVPAALLSRVDHEYQVHEDAVISITPRVNGNEVSASLALAAGTFELAGAPIGAVTADVSTAFTTPAAIVTWLCDRVGRTADGDALAALPSYPLGLWYGAQATGDRVLQDVADSLGGFWNRNALGDVVVYQLTDPDETPDLVLGPDDIAEGGLTLLEVEPPIKTLTLCYDRNFAVASRDSLAGEVLTDEPALADKLSTEWQKVTATNALGGDYPLAQDATVYTHLLNPVHAQLECDRRSSLRAVERQRWQLVLLVDVAETYLGATVSITYPGDGWQAGRKARILSMDRDQTRDRVVMEVWL